MYRSNSTHSQRWFVVALCAAILIYCAVAADAQVRYGEVQQGDGSTRCCLNNFRFAGTCEVAVGGGGSCYDVVSYLNNFQSVGRTYCGGTLVRGGWTQVRCQETSSTGGGVTSGSAVTAPPAQSPQTVRPAQTAPVGTTNQTFVTPVDASAAKVQQAGIINL